MYQLSFLRVYENKINKFSFIKYNGATGRSLSSHCTDKNNLKKIKYKNGPTQLTSSINSNN